MCFSGAAQFLRRIKGFAIPTYLEVEVGACRTSGLAYGAQGVTGRELVSHLDMDLVQVRVASLQSAAVIDDDQVAVAPCPTGANHDTGATRAHRASFDRSQIHALVKALFSGDRMMRRPKLELVRASTGRVSRWPPAPLA